MEVEDRVARRMRKSFPWRKLITPQFQFHFSIAKPAKFTRDRFEVKKKFTVHVKRFLNLPLRDLSALRIAVCELPPGEDDLKNSATKAKLGTRVCFYNNNNKILFKWQIKIKIRKRFFFFIALQPLIGYLEKRTETMFKFQLTSESERTLDRKLKFSTKQDEEHLLNFGFAVAPKLRDMRKTWAGLGL